MTGGTGDPPAHPGRILRRARGDGFYATYDPHGDVLAIDFADAGPIAGSGPLSARVVADYDARGAVVGLEVSGASLGIDIPDTPHADRVRAAYAGLGISAEGARPPARRGTRSPS